MASTHTHIISRFGLFALCFFVFAALAPLALAQADVSTVVSGGLNQTAGFAGYGGSSTDIFAVIGSVIRIILGLLGLILFLLLIYAGILWMTAQGNGDQVTKAKDIISSAVVGMLIILSAFAVSSFVTDQLSDAARGGAASPAAVPAGP